MSKRPKRKPLPSEPCLAEIESLSPEGRGVAHADGKAVFVFGALPGERVRFIYTASYRDYAEGKTIEVLEASPLRVEPRCPHYGVCGGCSLQHLAEASQIEQKQQLLLEQFRRIGKVEPETVFPPLTGPHWGYRHKARLGVKWVPKKNKVLVGFREQASAFIADLETCPVLHPQVGERLQPLAASLARLTIRDRLPQIEVAVGEESAALVFRVLAEPAPGDLDVLRSFGAEHGFDLYLQPGGPDSVVPLQPTEPAMLNYRLTNPEIDFRFKPTDFTQVNVEINRRMVERVLEILDPTPGEQLLDLFCGIGNFTLPLARRAGTVIGVEGSRESVERARLNARQNGIGNAEFHLADLSVDTADLAWARLQYDKVLLDPSRAGALEVLQSASTWAAHRVVYVSCNPATLARDAALLVYQSGYRLIGAGVMDMFPHTAHVESIALFERR